MQESETEFQFLASLGYFDLLRLVIFFIQVRNALRHWIGCVSCGWRPRKPSQSLELSLYQYQSFSLCDLGTVHCYCKCLACWQGSSLFCLHCAFMQKESKWSSLVGCWWTFAWNTVVLFLTVLLMVQSLSIHNALHVRDRIVCKYMKWILCK